MKLILEKIRKAYSNKALAVDEVSLAVADGQMAVLLGPSGCGKTTLLRLISGLEVPDSGKITLDGHDITNWEPKRRDIAMVFQNYALYPHMSVRGNLEFGLKSRNIPKSERDQSVGWAAGMLGLTELLNRQPKELSGGQRQRVALGRAIVRRPKLYLFDEPLSNLDAELRMRMRGEILSLHRRVRGTSIYVTHDQVEAMSLADVIFIMKQGRIISSGTPKELYSDPPDLFTAGFLGFPAMNLIDGNITNNCFVSSFGLNIPLAKKAKEGTAVFGIRPEDVIISDKGEIAGEILSIENLGRQELLLVQFASGDRLKLIAAGSYSIGDKIRFAFASDKAYLFDKESGKSVQG
jgi:ABC-type sugar transport system ATPase subunit